MFSNFRYYSLSKLSQVSFKMNLIEHDYCFKYIDSLLALSDKSNNYMEMRGMIIGPVVDVPSPNNDPSSVIIDKPAENNLALKSDGILARTGVSRVLAFSLFILAVLLVIWIWTGAPNAAAKQDRKVSLLLLPHSANHGMAVDEFIE